jgi:hypothetical protein
LSLNVGATVKTSILASTLDAGRLWGTAPAFCTNYTPPNHATVVVSFAGTLTVSRGTGRYAHAHGHGGFYGVINRKTYAYGLWQRAGRDPLRPVIIQETGHFTTWIAPIQNGHLGLIFYGFPFAASFTFSDGHIRERPHLRRLPIST